MRSAYNLTLTEDEAVGLLNIIMMTPVELSDDQMAAAEKIGLCCRQLMVQSASSNGEDDNTNVISRILGQPPLRLMSIP